MSLLETHNLTKSFGRMVAVDHVDLTLADGQLTAVIGPNGAGKTTLFDVITGRLRPTAGRITFRGSGHHRLALACHCQPRHCSLIPGY